MSNKASYDTLVMQGLSRAYDQAKAGGEVRVDLATARVIVLSDLHRGNGRRSDDFQRCALTFKEALEYYRAEGFTLILLGDAEDLWKYSPREVRRAHRESLSLERAFAAEGRYYRIVGNHDELWRDRGRFRKWLGDLVGQVDPIDGLGLVLTRGDEVLGRVFLTHGHQGTLDSDRLSWLSRLVLRCLYRPFQQLTGHRTTTPSTSIELRDQHSLAMYAWSEGLCREKTILVAGHTHMPVFLSLSHVEQLVVRREVLMQSLLSEAVHRDEGQAAQDERILKLEADIETVQGRMRGARTPAAAALLRRPSYFNTGCCSYSDGDITGIEIAGREIGLVRWKHEGGGSVRTLRASSDLVDEVFAKL